MGLMNELGIDPSQVDADAIEQQMASGGLPPEGIHHAVVNGCREVSANSGSKGYELTFQLLSPTGNKAEVKETIWLPNDSQDATKRAKSKARVMLFGHRLGILRKVAKGDGKGHTYQEAKPGASFTDTIGAPCFVEIEHEAYDRTGKDGKRYKGTEARVKYGGIFAIDDPTMKQVPRGSAAGVAAAVAGATAVKQPVDEFGDI